MPLGDSDREYFRLTCFLALNQMKSIRLIIEKDEEMIIEQ